MPSILKGRVMSCLVLAVLNAAVCVSSVCAQEKAEDDWLEIWNKNGFIQLSNNVDELLDQFKNFWVVSNSEVLTDFFLDLNDSSSEIETLNFGYEFNSSTGKMFPVLALEDSSVNLQLNLYGINRDTQCTQGNLLQISGKTEFNKAVSLQLASVNKSGAMLNVGISGEAVFKSGLEVIQRSPKANTLVDLEEGSSLVLKGSSVLSFLNNSEGVGILFQGQTSNLVVTDSLTVNAAIVFSGAGKIVVKEGASVVLTGSLKDFSGEYVQLGGTFKTSGHFNKDDDGNITEWHFTNVDIETDSSNLFKISASNWSLSSLQARTLDERSTFHKITLTDDKVALDYLLSAQKIYEGSELVALGEVYVREGQLSEITLKNDFNVLENPNLILSHVTLNLQDETELKQDLKIGALKLDSEGELRIQEGKNIVLYSSKGEVTENISTLIVAEDASLLIHGQAIYSNVRSYYEPTWLSSNVRTEEGSDFILSGQVVVTAGTKIDNHGKMRIASNAAIRFIGEMTQGDKGSLEIEPNSTTQFHNSLKNEGNILASGTLLADEVHNSGQITVSGLAAVTALKVESEAREGNSASVQVQNGGILRVRDLEMVSSRLSVTSGKEDTSSWLMLDKLSMNGSLLTLKNHSVLLYGVSDTELNLQKESVEGLLKRFGLEDSPVLALNSSMKLDGTSTISLGNQVNRENGANLVFGDGSVLLFNPQIERPLFTSDGTASIALEKGSKLIVLDPFNLGYLTDSSVEIADNFIGSEIVSANSNVVIGLSEDELGWKFSRVEILEKNFLYPQLQKVLYNNFADFNVNSENIGARFFARVDNEKYMNTGLSHRLLAEGTQLAALTGAKTTAFLNAEEEVKRQVEQTAVVGLTQGEVKLYGGIIGSAVFSKHINSYLGADKFKAFSEGISVGAVYAASDSLKVALGAAGVRASSKASGSVMEAKNKQWNYAVNLSLRKDFADWYVGTQLGVYHTKNNISGMMPFSMAMDDLKLKDDSTFMSFGVLAGWQFKEWGQVSLRPTVWHFPSNTDTTKIGNKEAFNLKKASQTFVELPLKLDLKRQIYSRSGLDFSLHGGIEGSVRAGQIKDKSSLAICGITASEKITTDRFSRWSAGADLSIQARTKNFGAEAFIAAQTGDARVSVVGGVKGTWRF